MLLLVLLRFRIVRRLRHPTKRNARTDTEYLALYEIDRYVDLQGAVLNFVEEGAGTG